MSDLEDIFTKLLGRQPSDADRQALYRVRDALGIKNNDALWLVIMALQSYDERYKAIPQAISKAATDAANASAQQAQAAINNAVAALVPSVEKAVEKAATDAVQRIELGRSLLSVWAGTLVLGIMMGLLMGLGWMLGVTTAEPAIHKTITWQQFFSQTWGGLGLGAAIPGLLAVVAFSDEMKKWQWGALATAIGLIALLTAKWWLLI
jgi:hypothetical protein